MEFSGRLASFPLGDLLQWANRELCNGALVIRRSEREKRVYFRDGEVVSCFSDDPAEFYGQHLLVNGHVTQVQLVQALNHCRKEGTRLGQALGELGILSPEVVAGTLRRQIEDTVCDLFLWPRGVFYFEHEVSPEDELLPEPIDTMRLAMEGARWIDEYERMRRVFVHDNIVLCHSTSGQAVAETAIERRILREVDGERSLEEIYRLVRGSYFRFLEAAFQLTVRQALDVLDVREPSGRSTSMEIRVADLLLEQAAEEQVLFSRRHLTLPYDIVERFCPAWVRQPGDEERGRMPGWAAEFCRRIDGSTSLGTLFSEDKHDRAREVEMLTLQLRKGALALLPGPLGELDAIAAAPPEEEGMPTGVASAAKGKAAAKSRPWWKRLFG